jgi:hypothetical protein
MPPDYRTHKAGNHAFRRFRNTYLRNYAECPEGLYKFWMGQSGKDMSDLYDKIREDVAFRRKWAERCGFGFVPSVVPNLPKCSDAGMERCIHSKSAVIPSLVTLRVEHLHATDANALHIPPRRF